LDRNIDTVFDSFEAIQLLKGFLEKIDNSRFEDVRFTAEIFLNEIR
jgi:hypothetical protein